MANIVQEEVTDNTARRLEAARYQRAKVRVEAIRGFYVHLAVYLIVNLGIFALNWVLVAVNGPSQNWFFYWPALGWGIAVLIHAFTVFGSDRFMGPEWEERKIREYLNRRT